MTQVDERKWGRDVVSSFASVLESQIERFGERVRPVVISADTSHPWKVVDMSGMGGGESGEREREMDGEALQEERDHCISCLDILSRSGAEPIDGCAVEVVGGGWRSAATWR